MSKLLNSKGDKKKKKRTLNKPKDKSKNLIGLNNGDHADHSEIDQPSVEAIQHPHYKPIKQQTTIRIDADVIQWLKGKGKGYQTRLNQILRDAMLEELKDKTMT